MPAYLAPGLYYETVDDDRERLAPLRTDVPGFVGLAASGPVHTPVRVTSWAQFQAVFGGFIPQAFLGFSVFAFFQNGGRACHVVRVAAGAVETESSGAAPPDGSASFVDSVEGFVPGAVVSVRADDLSVFDHRLAGVDVVTQRLDWEQPLEAELLAAATLTFATGVSPSSALLLDGAGQPTLAVRATSPGAWGNRLEVQIGRTHTAATRTRNTPQPASGAASYVESVIGVASGALVRVTQDQPPGPPLVTHHVVAAVDAAFGLVGWVVSLEAGYDLTRPLSFEVVEFSLSVLLDGRLRETLAALSLVEAHAAYAPRAIAAASRLIAVSDLHSISPLPDRLPDPHAANLKRGRTRLRGGRDGLAALTTAVLAGSSADAVRRGLRALELVDEVSVVAIPDALAQAEGPPRTAPLPVPDPNPCLPCSLPPPEADPLPPPLAEWPPVFSLEAVARIQQAMVEHCERLQFRVALIDAPRFTGGVGAAARSEQVEVAQVQAWRRRFDSCYAALYFPWVLVADPLAAGGRVVRAIPPSGHVAGVIARTDLAVGVHRAPANEPLEWAQDLTSLVEADVQGILNPAGVNCLRSFPGRGLLVYGARTVSSDGAWRYLNVRRLVCMIEKTLQHSLQWAVFEPNGEALRRTLSAGIASFLEALWAAGALAGVREEEAFSVRCDEENNPAEQADAGQLLVEIGLAPAVPAEFVVFRIGRTDETFEVTE